MINQPIYVYMFQSQAYRIGVWISRIRNYIEGVDSVQWYKIYIIYEGVKRCSIQYLSHVFSWKGDGQRDFTA